MAQKSRARAARRHLLCLALSFAASLSLLLFSRPAAAEKILNTIDGWEVFTDGRAGGFASWVYGNGLPATVYVNNYQGVAVPLQNISGGGFSASHAQGTINDPSLNFPPGSQLPPNAGTIDMWRIRSGFIANVFGFGVRGAVTPTLRATLYIQFWAFVESEGRQKNVLNYVDARQGYAMVQGSWGSLLAGRTRALFSRGATDIDALYAHRWGVGFPGPNSIDSKGPTVGQIGFGVHGAGFAPAIIYGTPVLGGLQLNIGAFDPIQLQSRGWTRTKYLRPEAELTFEKRFGATGKLVLFGNGTYQQVYKDGFCSAPPCNATAAGVGYGGRFELGPLRFGFAGDYGKGLGLNYALESTDASQDQQGNLRTFDSYYAQLMLVFGRLDLFGGVGIERVFLTDFDKSSTVADPRDPLSADPATAPMAAQVYAFSPIKYQLGANWGVVFNVTPNLHFDLDFFRAEADWYAVNGFPGAKQVVWVSNGGMIVNW